MTAATTDRPNQSPALDAAEAALDGLRHEYVARYGVAVLDLKVGPGHDGPRLEGHVLLPGQLEEARRRVEDVLGRPVGTDVRVLVSDEAHFGWYRPAAGLLDIRGGPAGELATQWLPEDPPVRVLAWRGATAGQLADGHPADGDVADRGLADRALALVQLPDGTVGWCEQADLVPVEPESAPDSVAEWRQAFAGAWQAAPEERWRAAAAEWLGTPYVWGGNSPRGVDCSGLVQRLVKHVAGLGLPKHSADQARAAHRIPRRELTTGDLVYLSRRDEGIRHIALVLGTGPDGEPEVVHAGLNRGVVIEPLSGLEDRYAFRAALRLEPGA